MLYNVNRERGAAPLGAQDFLCPDPVEAQARQSASLSEQIKAALSARRPAQKGE